MFGRVFTVFTHVMRIAALQKSVESCVRPAKRSMLDQSCFRHCSCVIPGLPDRPDSQDACYLVFDYMNSD